MKFLKIFIAGLVILVGAVWWIFSGVERARGETSGFCNATRFGEPLPQLELRAKEHGLSLEKLNTPKGQPEAYAAIADSMLRRFGCTLELRDGRVIGKRSGELPRE